MLFPVTRFDFFTVMIYENSLTSDLENLHSSARSHGAYLCQVSLKYVHFVKKNCITQKRC